MHNEHSEHKGRSASSPIAHLDDAGLFPPGHPLAPKVYGRGESPHVAHVDEFPYIVDETALAELGPVRVQPGSEVYQALDEAPGTIVHCNNFGTPPPAESNIGKRFIDFKDDGIDEDGGTPKEGTFFQVNEAPFETASHPYPCPQYFRTGAIDPKSKKPIWQRVIEPRTDSYRADRRHMTSKELHEAADRQGLNFKAWRFALHLRWLMPRLGYRLGLTT